MVYSIFGGKAIEKLRVLLGIVDLEIGNAVVVEGRQHVFAQRVLQRDAVGNHVVEKLEDVVIVAALRGRRHAEHELRGKVGHDFAVAFGACSVAFVNDHVVERERIELVKVLDQGRHHGKHAAGVGVPVARLDDVVGVAVAQNALEAFL